MKFENEFEHALAVHRQGKLREAFHRYEAILQADPQHAQALHLSGVVLHQAGQYEAAAERIRASLAIDRTRAEAWSNLAQVLEALGRQDSASHALEEAARHASAVPAPERARSTLESALAREPASAPLRFGYASLLENAGEPEAAAEAYAYAIRLDPSHGPALSQLVFLKRWLADWRDLPSLERQFREGVAKRGPLLSPFVLLGQPSTREEQRQCADHWSSALGGTPLRTRRTLQHGKLRLGYLSSDFHAHPTAFLAAGLFERHDRSRFEVIAYSMGPDDASPMRARLMRAFDRFVDVRGAAPELVASRIRDDGIDLLVDLKGHTAGLSPRILALHPAPIQAHYLGYPGTLGGGLVDYLIGDAIVTPPAHAAAFAEALVRLPGSYQVNDRNRAIVEAPPRSALGVPDDAVVLCNFGAIWKLRPEVLDAWATIAMRVPHAVLWLLARRDGDPAIANLRRETEARGIEPSRLVFATARPNAEMLGLYARADLCLDTWPYSAHTTGSEALWAGCPVLTMHGSTFAGRIGASLSQAVGLPDLVAEDVDDYIVQAIALALVPETRTRLRRHLAGAGRRSGLFDTEQTTRALERAYLAMADQYRRGVREPIDVE